MDSTLPTRCSRCVTTSAIPMLELLDPFRQVSCHSPRNQADKQIVPVAYYADVIAPFLLFEQRTNPRSSLPSAETSFTPRMLVMVLLPLPPVLPGWIWSSTLLSSRRGLKTMKPVHLSPCARLRAYGQSTRSLGTCKCARSFLREPLLFSIYYLSLRTCSLVKMYRIIFPTCTRIC